jgi:hypothetical protein
MSPLLYALSSLAASAASSTLKPTWAYDVRAAGGT